MNRSHPFQALLQKFLNLTSIEDQTPVEQKDLRWWQERILSTLLTSCKNFVLIAYLPSIFACFYAQEWAIAVIDTLALFSLLFLQKDQTLEYPVRARLFILILLVLSLGLIALVGMSGAGFLWLLATIVLSALLQGLRFSLILIMINTVFIGGVAWFWTLYDYQAFPLSSPLLWLVMGSNTVLLSIMLAAVIVSVTRGVETSFKRVHTLKRALSQERSHLIEVNHHLQSTLRQKEESEAIRHRLETHLRQADRLDALGRMARGIAHDLNNILHPIISHAELIQSSDTIDEESMEDAQQVIHSAQYAKRLVKSILTFGQRVDSQIEAVNLKEVIDEVVTLVQAGEDHTVDLTIIAPHQPLFALADQLHLVQILVNLCNNAYQIMDTSACLSPSLTIRYGLDPQDGIPQAITSTEVAHQDDHSKRLERVEGDLTLLHHQRSIWISITDTGPGMDKKTVDHIFEPFFTTREDQGGTGLGLSIVHGLVLGMKGQISLSTELGKGTRFMIRLPCPI